MRHAITGRLTRALGFVGLGMTLAGAGTSGSRIDTDGDGRYSLLELRAFYPALTAREFARIDADSDGRVSPGEFRAAQDEGLLVMASGN